MYKAFDYHFLFSTESGHGLKRSRGPDAVGDLQHHSKQLRMLGQDPLPGTLHQAQLAGTHQGPFSQVHIKGPPILVAT